MPLPGAESAFLFSCQVINTPATSLHTQRPKKKPSSIKLRKMPSFGQRAARYLGFELDEPVEEEERRSPVLRPEVHGSLVSVVEQQPSELVRNEKSGLDDQAVLMRLADSYQQLMSSPKTWKGQGDSIGPALYCTLTESLSTPQPCAHDRQDIKSVSAFAIEFLDTMTADLERIEDRSERALPELAWTIQR